MCRLGIEQEKPNDRELYDLCEESGDDLCEESGAESDEAGAGDLTRFLIVGVLVISGTFLRPLSRLLGGCFVELFKRSVIDNDGFSGILCTKSINISFK